MDKINNQEGIAMPSSNRFSKEFRGVSCIDFTDALYESIDVMRSEYSSSCAILNILILRVEELLVREGPSCTNHYIDECLRRLINHLPKASSTFRTDLNVFTILFPAQNVEDCTDYMRSFETITRHPVLVNNTTVPLELVSSALFVDSSTLSAQDLYGMSRTINLNAKSNKKTIVSKASECDSTIVSLKESYITIDIARTSLENQAFEVFYQPIFDNYTKKIVGFESLARLNIEDSSISPAVFIPPLRSLRMTGELDIQILALTLEQIPFLAKEAPGTRLIFSVNVSSDLFISDALIESYLNKIDSYNLTAGYPYQLQIEIIEETFGEGMERVSTFIHEIRRRGYSVVIDDFGMGNSTLSRLIDLQVDGLKLDKFFSDQIEAGTTRGLRLLTTLISALNDSGYTITAEGVETNKQLEWLASKGINKIQGYLFSRPLPLQEAAELLRRKAPIPPAISVDRKISRFSLRNILRTVLGLRES